MAPEEDFEKTYYCLHQDDHTLRTRATPIRVSKHKKVLITKTATGDDRDYEDITEIVFDKGTYVCTDPEIADFLDIYTPGGKWMGRTYEPNSWGYIITDKDPSQKVKIEKVNVETIVEVTKYPMNFVQGLNIKALESLCVESKIPLDGVEPGKASYIELLRSNGFIKE